MDVKIENGAVAVNGLGMPETVTGLPALLQRARFRLTVPRGAFLYDRALGSRLHTLSAAMPHAAEQALGMAREALLPCPEITAVSAAVTGGAVTVSVDTALGQGSVTAPIGEEEKHDGI